MKTIANFFFFLFFTFLTYAQCPSGTLGVSGTGCGCLSGCNLTSFGGPNCNGTTGNCNAGQIAMSADITVPAGCIYTVTATMSNRGSACSASGADGGDQLKVDIPGGSKAFIGGGGNTTSVDSYAVSGPGTIRVSGTANRQDEIITWSTTSSGCVNCSISLPVEILRFDARASGENVECTWETGSEINTGYFTVERSTDGVTFEPAGSLKASGTENGLHSYKLYDSSPVTEGVSYYRLRQTDLDGTTITYPEIVSVRFGEPSVSVFPNPSEGKLTITGRNLETAEIVLMNAFGEEIPLTVVLSEGELVFQLSELPAGLYLLFYSADGETKSEKIIVTNGQ